MTKMLTMMMLEMGAMTKMMMLMMMLEMGMTMEAMVKMTFLCLSYRLAGSKLPFKMMFMMICNNNSNNNNNNFTIPGTCWPPPSFP